MAISQVSSLVQNTYWTNITLGGDMLTIALWGDTLGPTSHWVEDGGTHWTNSTLG